jgi:hypothetical protein
MLIATLAQGQVAAPSLVPGTFGAENPAVIKWGSPSRIGVLAQQAVRVTDPVPGTPSVPAIEFTGAGGGFRLVGETVALGGEVNHLETQGATPTEKHDRFNGSLALLSGTALALGLGYDGYQDETSATLATPGFKTEGKVTTLGFSLRMGESLFVGSAVGRESVAHTLLTAPVASDYGERDVFKVGAAWRRAGTVLVHAEAFNISKADFSGTVNGGEETTGGTLEFVFGPVLLAYQGRRSRINNLPVAVVDAQAADIGWAPRTGFSLAVHAEDRVIRADAFTPPPPAPPTPVAAATIREALYALVLTLQW